MSFQTRKNICSSSEHKLRYFWWNLRDFWPSTTTFKKGSKDIVKIVNVTSVVQPPCYEATRILFVHKETKMTTLFNYFLSSVSVFDVHSQECHDACVCIPLSENKAQRIRILRQNADSCVSSTKRMCRDTLVNAQQRLGREELLNKVIIFVFFVHKKYSRSFMKLRLKYWCHMDHFNYVLTTFLGLECVSCIAVYEQRRLSDFIKAILICVLKMNKGLTGLEQHEGE